MIWSFFENQMPHRRESNVFEFQFFLKWRKWYLNSFLPAKTFEFAELTKQETN